MKALRLTTILTLILLLGYFGVRTYQEALLYESTTSTIAQESDAAALAQGKLDKLTSLLTLGFIEDETKVKITTLTSQKERHHQAYLKNLYIFVSILALLLLFGLTCSQTAHVMLFAIGSLFTLVLGLISPILMVTIHKQVDYLGDVVLSFESKSILSSIFKLFDQGEIVIGVVILLFSVLIPLFKIITLITALIAQELHLTSKLVYFFKSLGKWSMLDVFVVSTLLVYLSSQSGDLTHAEVGVGIYFFLIYVLLSMITTLQTQKILTAKSPSSHRSGLEML